MTSERHMLEQIINLKMVIYQYEIYTGIHKSKYYWTDNSCSIQINFNRENITIVSNMLDYKLKVMC